MSDVINGLTIDLAALDNGGHNDPTPFDGASYHRWIAYMVAYLWLQKTNAKEAAQSYGATSTTSVTVGIGEQIINVGQGKGYVPGQVIVVRSASNPNAFMTGTVTSYSSDSGLLAFNVLPGGFVGSGSYSDWTVNLGGERGLQGESGIPGLPFLWSADTSASNPGAGWLRASAADISTVTNLYASTTADAGGDIAALIDMMDDSTTAMRAMLVLTARNAPARWAAFELSNVSGTGAWRTLSVVYKGASSATPFVAGDQIGLTWLRTGDRGGQGPAGSGSTVMTQSEGVDVGIAQLLNFADAFNLDFNSGTGALTISLRPEALAAIGEVKYAAIPPGLGWLECDGSAYLQADYSALASGLGTLKTMGRFWFPRTLPSLDGASLPVVAGLYAGGKHIALGKANTPEVSTDTVNWQTAISWPVGASGTTFYRAAASALVSGTPAYVLASLEGIVRAGSDARTWAWSAQSPSGMGSLNYNIEGPIVLARVADGTGEGIALFYQIGSGPISQFALTVDGGANWTPSYTYHAPGVIPVSMGGGQTFALAISETAGGVRQLWKISIDRTSSPNPRVQGALISGLPSGKWRTIVSNPDLALWMIAEEGSRRVAISRDADAKDWDATEAPIAGDITSMASVGGLILATSANHDLAMIYDGSRWSQSKLPTVQNGYPLILPGNNAVLAFADNHPDARIACLSPLRHYDPATHFAVPALDTPTGALAASAVKAYINGGVN